MSESEYLLQVGLPELIKSSAHLGHQTRFAHPLMFPYICGQYNKIHILNLEKTLPLFQEALNFAYRLASRRGVILFVCTKRQAREILAQEAQRAGMPFVENRWLGGTLTNYSTLIKSVGRLQEMQAQVESGLLETLSKKDGLIFTRKLNKLRKDIGGVQKLERLPDALFVVDVGYHKIAVTEAKKLGIPVIGVVDSNHSPAEIDYPIPGNDDARRAIRHWISEMTNAIIAGRQAGGAKSAVTQTKVELVVE